MMSVAELERQRVELANDLETFHQSVDGPMTAEQKAEWETRCAEYEAHKEKIAAAQDHEQRAAHLAAIQAEKVEQHDELTRSDRRQERRMDRTITEEHRSLALNGIIRHLMNREVRNKQQIEALHRCGISERQLFAGHFDVQLAPVDYDDTNLECHAYASSGRTHRRRWEFRQNLTTPGSAGGFLIPEGFQYELEKRRLQFNTLRGIARVVQTTGGQDWPWPKNDDTANKGSYIGENTEVTETPMVYDQIVLKAWKVTSDMVKVSEELMEDSAFDMASDIGMALGERIGRAESEKFAVGAGTTEPEGVTVGASSGLTWASNSAITEGELIDLQESLDMAYQDEASVRWLFNQQTRGAIRKLAESTGQFLWQPGLQMGAPDMILGKPYTVSNDMPGIGASAVSIVYGVFSKFIIRDVRTMRFYRLNERYREFDLTAFLAFMRSSSHVLQDHALKAAVHPA